MNISSDITPIQATAEQVYTLVTDCTGLEHHIPGVQDWVAGPKQCGFTVPGAGHIDMSIQHEEPYSHVVYAITNAMTPQSVELHFHIGCEQESSTLRISTDINLPFMVAQMMKAPLQKFVNTLVLQIKAAVENRH